MSDLGESDRDKQKEWQSLTLVLCVRKTGDKGTGRPSPGQELAKVITEKKKCLPEKKCFGGRSLGSKNQKVKESEV